MNKTHLHQGKIILPNEMRFQQAKPQQVEVQVPIFPIPVRSKESFIMYTLCVQAIESGLYANMPEILAQLTTMRQGLEAAYLKLAIPLYEYQQFFSNEVEEVMKITGQFRQLLKVRGHERFTGVTPDEIMDMVQHLYATHKGGENAEMGTQKQEKE